MAVIAGLFCDHVTSLRLLVPFGEILDIGPEHRPDRSGPRPGGMGLPASWSTPRSGARGIETSRLVVDTYRTTNFDVLAIR